jgi:membrane protein YqaA with SNARE-associated domain
MFGWSEEASLGAVFMASFLSATVLPANSEIVLAAFVRAFPERVSAGLLVATCGNTLGGMTTYALGRLLPARYVPGPRALARMRRFGPALLLLSWVPFVGDALCLAAGWLRLSPAASAFAMAVGKLARYAVVVAALR